MRLLSIVVGLVGIALLPQLANAQGRTYGCTTSWCNDDPFSDYLQRGQSIAIGAGNDQEVNQAIQTITPWPRYVGNRRIPMQGHQGVDAVQRMYRVPDPFAQQGPGGAASGAGSPASGTGASGAGVGMTGSPVTPMQPISSGFN
jgi:hypothetical protein